MSDGRGLSPAAYDRAVKRAHAGLLRWAALWEASRPGMAAAAGRLAESIVRAHAVVRLPEGGRLVSKRTEAALLADPTKPEWPLPRGVSWVALFPVRARGSSADGDGDVEPGVLWHMVAVEWDPERDLVRASPAAQAVVAGQMVPWVYAVTFSPAFPDAWRVEPLCPESFEDCVRAGVGLRAMREEALAWVRSAWHVLWVWAHPHTVRNVYRPARDVRRWWERQGMRASGAMVLERRGGRGDGLPRRAHWVDESVPRAEPPDGPAPRDMRLADRQGDAIMDE